MKYGDIGLLRDGIRRRLGAGDRIGFADRAKSAFANRHTFVCLFAAVRPASSPVRTQLPTRFK